MRWSSVSGKRAFRRAGRTIRPFASILQSYVPENVAIVSLGQECQRDNPRLASKVGSENDFSTTFRHFFTHRPTFESKTWKNTNYFPWFFFVFFLTWTQFSLKHKLTKAKTGFNPRCFRVVGQSGSKEKGCLIRGNFCLDLAGTKTKKGLPDGSPFQTKISNSKGRYPRPCNL